MVEFAGWAFAFAGCAAMVGLGFIAVVFAVEPPRADGAAPQGWAARLRYAVIDPFADFMRRRYWFAILAFIALFKLGEALAGIMTAPFYRQLGFTRLEVASVSSVFGLMATLAGALAGGWLVAKLGTGRALILTGVTQMLSNLM
jgi:PAT family beta-lactamase induction signal transducer AmpG